MEIKKKTDKEEKYQLKRINFSRIKNDMKHLVLNEENYSIIGMDRERILINSSIQLTKKLEYIFDYPYKIHKADFRNDNIVIKYGINEDELETFYLFTIFENSDEDVEMNKEAILVFINERLSDIYKDLVNTNFYSADIVKFFKENDYISRLNDEDLMGISFLRNKISLFEGSNLYTIEIGSLLGQEIRFKDFSIMEKKEMEEEYREKINYLLSKYDSQSFLNKNIDIDEEDDKIIIRYCESYINDTTTYKQIEMLFIYFNYYLLDFKLMQKDIIDLRYNTTIKKTLDYLINNLADKYAGIYTKQSIIYYTFKKMNTYYKNLCFIEYKYANEIVKVNNLEEIINYSINYRFLNEPDDKILQIYHYIDGFKNDIATLFNLLIEENEKQIKKIEEENFINSLMDENNDSKRISINDIDLMNGYEFEEFVAHLFTELGYNAHVTKKSGDQGIDVFAQNSKIKIAIQTKRYTGVVGNKSVQEAIAGKVYYKCDKGIVITNNYFTKSAIELAKESNIDLWDRDKLISMIDFIKNLNK